MLKLALTLEATSRRPTFEHVDHRRGRARRRHTDCEQRATQWWWARARARGRPAAHGTHFTPSTRCPRRVSIRCAWCSDACLRERGSLRARASRRYRGVARLTSVGAGVLQLMVEGGAECGGTVPSRGLVDEYVLYLAPAFMGGDRGRRAFAGEGAPTMAELTRGRFVAIDRLGDDLRIVVVVER